MQNRKYKIWQIGQKTTVLDILKLRVDRPGIRSAYRALTKKNDRHCTYNNIQLTGQLNKSPDATRAEGLYKL